MRRAVTITAVVLGVLLLASGIWLHNPDLPRAALERRWAPPPPQFVEVAGVRLHLRDTGQRDGPPVLLIHGLGLHTWEAWTLLLEDRFRVLAAQGTLLDPPGRT